MPPSEAAVDVLEADDPLAAFAEADRDGRLLALRTSGTTGTARTVLRSTASWTRSFPHVSALARVDASSRVWIPGPLTATMNLFAAAHTRWAGAARVTAPDQATHAHLTPTALRRELATAPSRLAGMCVVVAGDRVERTTYDAARRAGVRVSHYYGAAELSFVAWGEHAEALRPFPGVEVAERDGELWVRSPYTCEGYLEPEHTLRRDEDGWTTVGDRGIVDRGLVRVAGRGGGITTGGSTVLVADIEGVLRRAAAGEVAVVGVPHADLGAVVVGVVTRAEDVPSLRALARSELSAPQRPRRWVQVDSLPLTPHGKVDRTAVAAVAARGVDA